VRNIQPPVAEADVLLADVFSITVRIPNGVYPSFNHTFADGFRGGKKSEEYKELKRAVRAAAHFEMKRIGWIVPAPWYVLIELVRIVPDRRIRDSSNLGKAELDALEPAEPGDPGYDPTDPFPGVYLNDHFAKMIPRIELDEGGIDRVTITARREYPPVHDPPQNAGKATRRRSDTDAGSKPAGKRFGLASKMSEPLPRRRSVEAPVYDGKSIPDGWALDGDVLVPLDQVLRQIQRRHVRRRF
jgi:hypothetical protein